MKNEQISMAKHLDVFIEQGEEHRNMFVEAFDDQIQRIKDNLNSLDETRDMAEKQYQAKELDLDIYNLIMRKLNNSEKELEELLKDAVDKRNEAVVSYNNLIYRANRLKRIDNIING